MNYFPMIITLFIIITLIRVEIERRKMHLLCKKLEEAIQQINDTVEI